MAFIDVEQQIAKELNIIVQAEADAMLKLDFTDTLLSFLPTLQTDHQARFDSRSSPSGESWPEWQFMRWPIDDALLGHQTLESSKTLRKSLMIGGGDNVSEIKGSGLAKTLFWGSKVPYAAIHNFGAEFTLGIPLIHKSGKGFIPAGARIKIPQREFVGLTPENVDNFATFLLDDTIRMLKTSLTKKGK